jgi:hypothetical protein
MEIKKKDPTCKIFRHLIYFVCEELLNQFINNNGDCNASTFRLINWSVITDKKIDGILKFKYLIINLILYIFFLF